MNDTTHTDNGKGMSDNTQAPYTTRAGAMSDRADTLEPKGPTVDTGVFNPTGDAVEAMREAMRARSVANSASDGSGNPAGAMALAPSYWNALHAFDSNGIKDQHEEEAWCQEHYYPFDRAMHAASINSTADAMATLDFVDVWARKLELLDEYDGMPDRLKNATAYLFAALGMDRPSGEPVAEINDPAITALAAYDHAHALFCSQSTDVPDGNPLDLADTAADELAWLTRPETIAGFRTKLAYHAFLIDGDMMRIDHGAELRKDFDNALGLTHSAAPEINTPADPIFAAIEKRAQLFYRLPDNTEREELTGEALDAITDTIPTTIAGFAAKIEYCSAGLDIDEIDAVALIRDAKVLAGIKVESAVSIFEKIEVRGKMLQVGHDGLTKAESNKVGEADEKSHWAVVDHLPQSDEELAAKLKYILNDYSYSEIADPLCGPAGLIQDTLGVVTKPSNEQPDPIYGLIKHWQAMQAKTGPDNEANVAAFDAGSITRDEHDRQFDTICERELCAYDRLSKTTPTTPEGLVAKMVAVDSWNGSGDHGDGGIGTDLANLIKDVRRMFRLPECDTIGYISHYTGLVRSEGA